MGDLTVIVGNHAKAKILEVLAESDRPLNPNKIVNKAGLGSKRSWYDYKDDLLETVVEQQEKVGNSPLYGLNDSPKAEAIRTLAESSE